jgi:DNA-binding XRE family transcriptional regulator
MTKSKSKPKVEASRPGRRRGGDGVDPELVVAKKGTSALALARNVLKYRLNACLSQDQLAAMSGIGRNTLRAMEKATRDQKLSNVEAVARVLDLPVVHLLQQN